MHIRVYIIYMHNFDIFDIIYLIYISCMCLHKIFGHAMTTALRYLQGSPGVLRGCYAWGFPPPRPSY